VACLERKARRRSGRACHARMVERSRVHPRCKAARRPRPGSRGRGGGPGRSLGGGLAEQVADALDGGERPVPRAFPEPDLGRTDRSEEHTSELQSLAYLVCRLLLEKKNNISTKMKTNT